MKRLAFSSLLALLPLSASAHPHIYIDAGVNFLFDKEGKLAALKVVWSYDDFYSLLLLEDRQLDQDGDGKLTAAEQEKINGFDTNWTEGYEGDLYVSQNGQPVKLGGPLEAGAKLQDGRLVSWHIRPVLSPIDTAKGDIALKAYDPTLYTAYTLNLGVEIVDNTACNLTTVKADLPSAYKKVESLLNGEDPAQYSADDAFPEVGELFADKVLLKCAPSL